MPVWDDEGELYYRCPVLYISDDISSWYEEYSYLQSFPGAAPPFGEVCTTFLLAMHAYRNYMSEYESKKQKTKSGKGKLSLFHTGLKKEGI